MAIKKVCRMYWHYNESEAAVLFYIGLGKMPRQARHDTTFIVIPELRVKRAISGIYFCFLFFFLDAASSAA